jgi:hypothetical protein
LLDCSIWCNQTRPSVLDRSISIPEQGRTFNYTLIPEANIPNKVSLIHNDNLDDEEPDSVAEPIQDEGGGSSGGGSAEGSQ